VATSELDPLGAFTFTVVVNGVTLGSFGEVSGLTAEGDTVAYGVRRTVRRPARPRTSTSVVLKRGHTANRELLAWYRNTTSGLPDRRSGTIIQKDERQNEVQRWNFQSAWINKIESADLNATANEVAIESLELTHEGLVLQTGQGEGEG
jgi:phage tail-like protein